MKNISNKAFTLVELLVVITILSIISVVAYQNFGWAVDKANAGRKTSDVATIETSLAQFNVDNNYYPAVDEFNATENRWGYNSWSIANISNTLVVSKSGDAIDSVTSAAGGWKVMWLDDWTTNWTTKQIGAKGTISQNTLGKKYLTKDLYDPELWDVKVGSNNTLIEEWIGRYVYAVFKKPLSADTDWSWNRQGSYYNIAYTVKVEGGDQYKTKIVWSYDSESCYDEKSLCPETLIGSSNNVLTDETLNSSSDTSAANQGIPYPITNF